MEFIGLALAVVVLTLFSQSGGQRFHFNNKPNFKESKDPADYSWIFRENGIQPDSVTYTNILNMIRSGEIEEAEQTIRTHYNLPFADSARIAWRLDRAFRLKTTNPSLVYTLINLGLIIPGTVILMTLAWAISAPY